jgi:poly-gamma-glutamate synthesis protein (capsule biosynthesis protein)
MTMTIFLCGDVMLGRGIDQILRHSVDPSLHEAFVRDARTYVELAEQRTGPIAGPVGSCYVWGDALEELERVGPVVCLINLETSITTSEEYWQGKEVHYRMHPANVRCLVGAGVDCCVLANNHVLDWGYAGFLETLRTLDEAGIKTVGAGRDAAQAAAPAVLDTGEGGRVLVLAFGSPSGGVPREWAATAERPGVNVLRDLSDEAVREIAAAVERHVGDGDVVIVSIHWGANWGYRIPQEQIDFAHQLIDRAGVDIVHGHSSHHIKGLEIYRRRLILYGCGDFLNDYEGITGHDWYCPDLTLMYFPTVEASTGALTRLRLAPMQIRHFRLNRAARDDAAWLRDVLNRESAGFGVHVGVQDDGMLAVYWE